MTGGPPENGYNLPAGAHRYRMIINGKRYEGVAEILAAQTTFIVVQEGVQDIPRTAEPETTNGKAPATPVP